MPDARRLYDEYIEFFKKAERKRRWSVYEDIPWDRWDDALRSEERALSAETFCGVEMYLPDYVSEGLALARSSFGEAWFLANWAYEESKHALVLREYLVRTGQRSEDDLHEFERSILGRRWELPFETPRRMIVYGAVQERTTWMVYRQQQLAAEAAADIVLGTIYRLVARDEAAHATFYERVLAICLEEDRDGTIGDMRHVMLNFHMPAANLVPDYEARISVVQTAGIDWRVYLRDAVLPLLRRLGVSRRDLFDPSAFQAVQGA